MSSVLNISEAASIAMHSMTLLAAREKSGPVSVKEMADLINISGNHLSKVVQRLSKSGLVASQRGPGGGVSLSKPAADITLLDVFEAVEGRLDMSDCLLKERKCAPGNCLLGDLIPNINSQVKDYFSKTTLLQLNHVFADL